MTIRKSILVERSPEISFRLFCEEIGRWWPKGPSFGGKELADMFIEGRIGGRFYERYVDGTEFEIGRVTAYQPPEVVAFTWRAPSWELATHVEIRFSAEGTATRVELEHSGWEQAENIRATSKSYEGGWDLVLGHYVTHVNAAA
jgi:uncharacterized protein YndB with AHSA1/START domain